jgi:carboxypeptidase D
MRGLCTLLAAALALALPSAARAKMMTKAQLAARQAAAAEQFHQRAVRAPALDAKKGASGTGVKNITFTNPKASRASIPGAYILACAHICVPAEFYVDGKSIPDVDWDVGPSWSGLLPISNKTGETRELFFWFFPPGPEGSLDDLVFWCARPSRAVHMALTRARRTNGGPGCSSLEGLLQENGPFSWSWGQAKPTQNQYSWTNISSMLYVEQPVGTGFSQGTPNIAVRHLHHTLRARRSSA